MRSYYNAYRAKLATMVPIVRAIGELLLHWVILIAIIWLIGVSFLPFPFSFGPWLAIPAIAVAIPLAYVTRRVCERARSGCSRPVWWRLSRVDLSVVILVAGVSAWFFISGVLDRSQRAGLAAEARAHFHVIDLGTVPSSATATLAEFERARGPVFAYWGIDEQAAPIPIGLFEDLEVYRRELPVPTWSAGGTACPPELDGPIIAVPIESAEEVGLAETPRHEMIHAAMCLKLGSQAWLSIPRWFHEGVAKELESGGLQAWGSRLIDMSRIWLRRHDLLLAEEFCHGEPGPIRSTADLFYATAHIFVHDLNRQFGADMPRRVTLATVQESFEVAFSQVVGLSCEQRYSKWLAGC